MLGKEKQPQKKYGGALFSSLSTFFKSMFHSLSSERAAQITFLFAKQTQTALILCLTACAESLQGGGRNLSRATQELFGAGFSPLCSKPVEPVTGHWARHRDTWMELKSGCSAAPVSGTRTAEGQTSLLKSNQKPRMTLSSSIARDMGFPTTIWKISSTYPSLWQRWGWFRPGTGSKRDCSISVLIFKTELGKNLINLLDLWNHQTSNNKGKKWI